MELKVKLSTSKARLEPYVCDGCGKRKTKERTSIDGGVYCFICARFLRKEKEARLSLQGERLGKSLGRIIRNCRILGTCGILEVHHDILKNDPDRLSTEFMVKMICGEDKLQEYIKSKTQRLLETYVYIPQDLFDNEPG